MASYIIKINKAVHSTSDQCNTAITNAGASITTNYKMLGSYKVEGTQEQVAAINGLKSSQLEADEVTSNLSIATANNTFLKQHGIDASGAPAWSPQSTVGEVVSALDSVAVHHAANDASDPKVVCMPFTMTKSQLIDDTLNDMLDDGLIVIAAAGNDGGEVDNFTPGGLDTVITVGAIDNSYKVMDITNRPIVDTSANIDLERSVNTNAKLDIFAIGKDVMIADSSNVANYVWQDGTSVSTAITSGICAQYIDIYSSQSANQIKSTLVTEGHIYARQTSNSSDSTTTLLKYTDLTFDSGKSLDSGNVSFSLAYAPQSTDVSFASHPSGRLFDIEYGSSANVNINISGSASNVAVIDFSPLSPWMTFNTGTGIVTADTSNSTLAPNSIAPGIYNFAVKGTVGSKTIVEEYSIGVYANGGNANDLNVADEYYYDDEANDYEAVISYAVAPTGPQKP